VRPPHDASPLVPEAAPASDGDAGFSLVGLIASCTIMLILMAAAVPSWRYVMKDMREEELIFRGGQIADAIARYQKKNANTAPASIDVLVKGKFLRKAYKDPVTRDGKWRLIHPGEAIAPIGVPVGGQPSPSPGFGASPSPSPNPSASPRDSLSGPGVSTGESLGAIVGVATTSKEQSLRIFNGRKRYDEWLFIAGQPRVVGLHPGTAPTVPGATPGGTPGLNPSPRPSIAR
jgi:type II secretory pathway pseudopilin PulG